MPSRFEYERAIRRSDLPSLARLIALTLATWADSKSARIAPDHQPSLSTIEEATGMSHAAVLKHLRTLEKGGWVERDAPTREAARSKKVKTRYQLRLPAGVSVGSDSTGVSRSRGDLDESDMHHLSRSRGDLDKADTRSPRDLDEPDNREGVGKVLGHEVTTSSSSTYFSPSSRPQEDGRNAAAPKPDPLRDAKPLIDAMTDAGIVLSWTMRAEEWRDLIGLIERVDIDVLVQRALEARRGRSVQYATYFLRGTWRGLPTTKGRRQPAARDSPRPTRPPCGGCDPDTRLVEIEHDGLPSLAPCPDCHPKTEGSRP